MKKLAAIIIILVFSTPVFSQLVWPEHNVSLENNQSFVKLPTSQFFDTVNTIYNESSYIQFESFDVWITKSDLKKIDSFMKDCKSINSIISTYGKVRLDLCKASNKSDIIVPLSGFYWTVDTSTTIDNGKYVLSIAYPRTDKMY